MMVVKPRLLYDSKTIKCKFCKKNHLLNLEIEIVDKAAKYGKTYRSNVSYQCPVTQRWSNTNIDYNGKHSDMKVINVL